MVVMRRPMDSHRFPVNSSGGDVEDSAVDGRKGRLGFNSRGVQTTKEQLWTSEGVDIEALEGNVFAFHFKNSEDRKRIQSGEPWSFNRALIALEEPTGAGDIAQMEFNKVEIWVQIHNVPLICMTEDSGNFLGSMIGEVKEVDLIEAKIIGGRIIRVRAVISTTEPLMRSLRVDLLGSGEITTLLLRYERLQDYCFKCSRLGHSFTDCSEPGPGKEATTEAMARLNVWLRTDGPPKRVNYRRGPFERQSWGNKEGKPFSKADQGNWRAGTIWKGTGKKPPESHAEGRSGNFGIRTGLVGEMQGHQNVSKQEGQVLQGRQVGVMHSLEPCKNLMRNDAAINTSGGDKITEIKFSEGEEQQFQAGKSLESSQAKELGLSGETAQVNNMQVDLPIVTGPIREPSPKTNLKVHPNSSGPSTDPVQQRKLPDTILIGSPSTSIQTLKKVHNSVKWKKVARTKGGQSDFGEIISLGKRGSFELSEEIQFKAKRTKAGLFESGDEGFSNFSLDKVEDNVVVCNTVEVPSSEVVRQLVTQPESVTSQEGLNISSILSGKKGSNKPAIALARQALLRKSDLIWRRHVR
ncbi:hypothetical protein EZV62_027598 [Acer yangbiense]|uniref:CCHC-type domain-containing protein n=1 Tax=Acer yangbiense TaxID=1000413 RepID=A0A5C7GU39_9ROSI|nr:hypothetical protein EZV62_027598 [Acer yangbiense]